MLFIPPSFGFVIASAPVFTFLPVSISNLFSILVQAKRKAVNTKYTNLINFLISLYSDIYC